MNIEDLFTEKTTIEISVVKLNNQKINKTIFNQIVIRSPFDRVYSLSKNVQFLGYVNDKISMLLWTNGVNIYRCRLKDLREFASFDLENKTIEKFEEYYSTLNLNYYQNRDDHGAEHEYSDKIWHILTGDEIAEIRSKQEFVKEILNALIGRQIFL